METTHTRALRAFARKLAFSLMFRRALIWATVWLFACGVFIIAARVAGVQQTEWLALSMLGVVPVSIGAALYQTRRNPSFSAIRATYDRLNSCGGIIMAEEIADMTAWHERLGEPHVPRIRWRMWRTSSLFGLAVGFVVLGLLLPARFTRFGATQPLEIGQLIEELQTEVETLKEEKILEENKALELQEQLTKLKDESSGFDPYKTWEALDHIKQSNADAAKQTAEDALGKLATLTQIETLAAALQRALESGLQPDIAKAVALDLGAMIKSANAHEALLKDEFAVDFESALEKLTTADLEKLLSSIRSAKCSLSNTVVRLANAKLIDANTLAKCQNAGQCPDISALAAFLCQNTNGCGSYKEMVISYCRGGVDRGRGDAPMTWSNGTDEEGAKFKEQTLPVSALLSDAQLVGVSKAAPIESGEDVRTERGALERALAGSGSGHASLILPRHRDAIQRYFTRKE